MASNPIQFTLSQIFQKFQVLLTLSFENNITKREKERKKRLCPLLQLNLPSTLFQSPPPKSSSSFSKLQFLHFSTTISPSFSSICHRSHCCFIHIAIFVPVSLDSISVFRRTSFLFLAFPPHCFPEIGLCGSVPLYVFSSFVA